MRPGAGSDQREPARQGGRGRPGTAVRADRADRHVRHRDHRGHLRLRRAAGPPRPGAVQPAPVRLLLRRGRRPAGRRDGAGGARVRRGDRAGDRRSRRAHPARAARAPGRRGQGAAGRAVARLRAVPRGQRRALPLGRRPGAARRLPAAVDHPQPAPAAGGERARRGSPRAVAGGHLPDQRLARAGDLGLLRSHLRRPSRADPDRDARRLEGPPGAQGLPARRHPGGIPRCPYTTSRGQEGLPVTAETEGRVYNVAGQDWDEVVAAADEATEAGEERIVVNMGPQHPSTHGVLRLILTLEGETVIELRPVIGYLHTGIEKNMEFRTWTQGVTFCTRADYLAPLFNETAYCMGVERLLGVEAEIPPRANVLRVLMMELNRIGSHLTAIGTMGLELGATTVFIYGMREREKVLDLLELITGLRMNHAYIRPGGVSQDLPAGALERLREFLGLMPGLLGEIRALFDAQPVYFRRTKNVAYLDLAGCMALGVTGPILRATGLPWDLRKSQPYCGYETYEFGVPTQDTSDAYGRYIVRMDEMDQSLKIIEQCVDRLAAKRPARDPVMVADAKIGWPAQLAVGADGLGNSPAHIARIMGQSMEALIHHFKLVTEGFRVPAGQVYAAVESPRGELGAHVVSDGGTRPFRVHLRDPSFTNLQSVSAMSEGGLLADVIAAVASIDPVMGGVDR